MKGVKTTDLSKVKDWELWRELWKRAGYHPVLVETNCRGWRLFREDGIILYSFVPLRMFSKKEILEATTQLIEDWPI